MTEKWRWVWLDRDTNYLLKNLISKSKVTVFNKKLTTWKVSVFGVILVRIFRIRIEYEPEYGDFLRSN